MSLLLVFGASVLVGYFAARTARRHASSYETRLAPRRQRERHAHGVVQPEDFGLYQSASLDLELRSARGERPAPLYTPDQARGAKRAMAPMWGITMRMKD